jgi:hypothetical protein
LTNDGSRDVGFYAMVHKLKLRLLGEGEWWRGGPRGIARSDDVSRLVSDRDRYASAGEGGGWVWT